MNVEGVPGGQESVRAPSAAERAFSERLAMHNARLSAPLPDMTTVLDRNGNMPSEQQVDKFASAHFDGDLLRPFRDHGERGPAQVSFTRNTLLEMGNDQSYHGTILGNMQLTSSDGAVVENHLVAVKPFLLSEGASVVQELAMLQQAARDGLSAVKPLALITDRYNIDAQRIFLVTELNQELSTLARENWRGVQGDEVAEALEPAVSTLVLMHENGMVHGDPQFKNIATGETQGTEIVFDLEDGRDIRGLLEYVVEHDEVPHELVWHLRQEFWRVRLSMRDYIYPRLPADQCPATPEERFMFELNTLFEPYHRKLSESSSPYRAALDRAYRAVLERTREEVSRGHEPPLDNMTHNASGSSAKR
jgi:hypothetical protein